MESYESMMKELERVCGEKGLIIIHDPMIINGDILFNLYIRTVVVGDYINANNIMTLLDSCNNLMALAD